MPTRSWLLSVVEGAVSSAGSFASCAGDVVPAPQAVRASSMRAASRVAMVLLRFMVLLPF